MILASLLLHVVQVADLPLLPVAGTVEGTVEDGDPVVETSIRSYTGRPTLGNSFRIEVDEAGIHHVDLRSWHFDAYLVLRDARGEVLAEDDDGCLSTHARVTAELDAGAVYRLDAGALHGGRGAFQVTLRRGAPPVLTPAERAAAEVADQERRVNVTEAVAGPESAAVARELRVLGELLSVNGQSARGREVLERAVRLHREVLGAEVVETALALNALAALRMEQGDLDAALPVFEDALAVWERSGGSELGAAVLHHNLAALLEGRGELGAARAHRERELRIRDQVQGPAHPESVEAAHDLAFLLSRQGELTKARQLLERVLAHRAKAQGAEHAETIRARNDLAWVLRSQGELVGARELLEQSLEIEERLRGSEAQSTAAILNNLALVEQALGALDDARRYRERALAIQESVLGPRDPNTLTSLNNLGALLLEQGDLAGARQVFERTLVARSEVLGPRHPETTLTRNNLAVILLRTGELEEARRHLERAHVDLEEALGAVHPSTARTRYNLALVMADLGDLAAARDLIATSRDERAWIRRTLSGLTESERFQYLATRRWELEALLSLCASEDPDVLAQGYGALLAWKGQIGRSLVASREQLGRELTAEQREVVERLRAKQAELSRRLSEEGAPGESPSLSESMRERNALELELERTLVADGNGERASLPDVRAAIPERGAVLDLFVHRVYTPAVRESGRIVRASRWKDDHVFAWIVRSAEREPALARVDLGPATELEAAVHGYLESLRGRRGEPVAGKARLDPGGELRRRLWEPLAESLAGVETLLVSPDGFLGTLPLETVPLEDGTFLVEHLAVAYCQDVASLPRREPAADGRGSLLAVGAVDFSKGDDWSDARPAESAPRGSFTDLWTPLRHSGLEVDAIAALHEATFAGDEARLVLRGSAATEERLKVELGRHAVVHLATHGFFQPEGTPSMWQSALDAQGRPDMQLDAEAAALIGRHPALLSGIVCAGANRPAEEGRDDGYLTAEEAGWLDLGGVELVVLSACETGLGRAKSGEGLIGLRRAFRLAGARTVVSSLWSVGDESTAELMKGFYANLWVKGMGRSEALRAAQLAMLQRNRMEHGAALPATWGAFVLSGEWR